ncbi:MAG: acyl-CoA dehydrogenase family protein, partial [Alphaproteobacteria bacterium]
MDFTYSERSRDIQARVQRFMEDNIYPRVREWDDLVHQGQFPPPFIEDLKAKAKAEGLWNMFLPGLRDDEPGTRLSNLDYAPVAEILGRVMWSSEVFNCNAPDTGNMELLHMFANKQQYDAWLRPLLEGKIRSAFVMTEPAVASSDATNIQTRIERVGDHYVINGRKWFITNAADPRCKISILMVVTNPDAETHRR